MTAYKHKLDPERVQRDYPITDRLDGWYFRIDEVSAGVWRCEGTDLWGRKVSADGTDEAQILAECVQRATRILSDRKTDGGA